MNHVGEVKLAKNGMKMVIIADRGDNDIDVRFENNVVVKNKSYLSFKRGTIKLPSEKKEQVAIMLDKEAKDILHTYSKAVGRNASDVINNLIKMNCYDYKKFDDTILATYGNNVSYLKNFDYSVLSKMSKEEFIGRYVENILNDMEYSIYHCIAPKCRNTDYGRAEKLYFRHDCNDTNKFVTNILLDLFDESINSFEDIVIAMFGKDSNEHYIVQIYNKYLDFANDWEAECWKHLYDYGVFIDDHTKQNPDGTYFTRIGSILGILNDQGREEEIENARKKLLDDFLKSVKTFSAK